MTNSQDLAEVMASQLNAAIDRSIQQNEIVAVTLDSISDISTVAAFAGDRSDNIDYTRENDGSYDMWGWSDKMEAAGNGDMEWRIRVTVAE